MPHKYDFEALFGSKQFKDFGYIDAERSLRVVYPLATQKFPIGYIGDKNTPADIGREVIEKTLGRNFGPICHVSLAHESHNIVEIVKDKYVMPIVFSCDGLIVQRTGSSFPFVIETFLGDCACIIIWSDRWIGYMHVGWPEIIQLPFGVIQKFFEEWPDKNNEISIWMGPCITGQSFERVNIPKNPSFLRQYAKEPTEWGTRGFQLDHCIRYLIEVETSEMNVKSFSKADIDPYAECSWIHPNNKLWAASDQWYRRKGRELGFPIYSPRNSAMLFVEG
ncbi:MAG: laccase domain-containing protein [Patescibacteria group bacterium]